VQLFKIPRSSTISSRGEFVRPAQMQMKKLLVEEGLTLLFSIFVLGALPWLFSEFYLIGTTILSFAVFNIVRSAKFLIPAFEAGSTTKDPAILRDELLNRLASILFNLSTGIPTYLSFYHLLPPFWWLNSPHTIQIKIPVACAWSFGYVIYDFVHLSKSNWVMRLHHMGEMVILLSNAYVPSIGTPYMLAGACTQISSSFLHWNKICYELSRLGKQEKPRLKKISQVIHVLLVTSWVHGRLLLFPLFMYYAWVDNPLTPLHILNFLTGMCLVLASAVWLSKIIKQTSNSNPGSNRLLKTE